MIKPDLAGIAQSARNVIFNFLKEKKHPYFLPSGIVKEAVLKSGLKEDEFMIKLLPLPKTMAYPGITHFNVGAMVKTRTGNVYFGANMEFPGDNLSFTVHGEQCAIMNAWHHDEEDIEALYVNYTPCGMCRQVMAELKSAWSMRIFVNENEHRLSDLYPQSFSPPDLGNKDECLMLRQYHNLNASGTSDALVSTALEAARKSYAPYTKAYSGVALEMSDGKILQGRYAENAAFNPSLNPMVTAIISLKLGGYDFSMIRRAVIVEWNSEVCSQASGAAGLLKAVNKNVELKSVRAALKQ